MMDEILQKIDVIDPMFSFLMEFTQRIKTKIPSSTSYYSFSTNIHSFHIHRAEPKPQKQKPYTRERGSNNRNRAITQKPKPEI